MDRFQGSMSNRDIVERNQGQPLKHSSLGPFIARQTSRAPQSHGAELMRWRDPHGDFESFTEVNFFSI